MAARIYSNLTRFDKASQIYETMLREIAGTEDYLYELAVVYQYANKLRRPSKFIIEQKHFLALTKLPPFKSNVSILILVKMKKRSKKERN